LAAQDQVLMLVLHHIVGDGHSIELLLRETLTFYGGGELPALQLQYRDYAAWQRRQLGIGSLQPHREYWLTRLAGELPVLDLAAGRPRPEPRSFAGGHVSLTFDETEHAGLLELSRHGEATPFMVLVALVKVLLYRYTGEKDIIVGSPVAGREREEFEAQVGLYVNTVVLRDRVQPQSGFEQLLRQVRDTAVAAYQHQAYPFDLLVEEVSTHRDVGRNPLFDVMVLLAQSDTDFTSVTDLDVSAFSVESRESRFDLTFAFGVAKGTLGLSLEYCSELFDRDWIEHVVKHLRTLLRAVILDPVRPIGTLAMLTQTTSPDSNAALAAPRHPSKQTVLDCFTAQARQAPDQIAVTDGGCALTYRDVELRANGVARQLSFRAVGPGDVVAVICLRSALLPVACLGILKVGAAYLPLDPAAPPSRLEALLADSGARLVVTDGSHPAGLDISDSVAIEGRVAPRTAAGDLAYVIYTSGSTGHPKAVGVEHGAFVNMALAQIADFAITPADRIAQFSAPSFDASLYEMFLALLSGASLAVVPEAAKGDAKDFLAWLATERPTVLVLPPAFLHALERAPLKGVRVLVTAGEAAHPEDARHYARTLRSINAYGPTECAVCSTWYAVASEGTGPIPIGRAVSQTTAYVLDELLQLLPAGVPGELCIGGAGVARGYLGRPDLTAERFVPDPFRPGGRLFRTGDRVMADANGVLQFLGRLDQQIKVRGYRVEPGEVEHHIRTHVGVCDALVIEHGGELLAYVVGATGGLREHLLGRLPTFMVPGRYVSMERLPFT
ncbi:MAG: amino acid adenylation domain-containing protein, partial [Chromatiales bacterium]|nr:amino acid adenylation domain-containing protein [Chromatiales bacterium]